MFMSKYRSPVFYFILSLFFAISFLLIKPSASYAATFYVDSVGGNDSNSGTSIDQAWKTISKVDSTVLSPGDEVLFKKGSTWREQLDVNQSGVEGNPIKYGAYGSGDNPLFIGTDIVTGFTPDGENIYLKAGFPYNPRQVFEDNVRLMVKSSKAAMVAGSFYWDSETETVYIWTTDSADPSSHTIEVSTRFRGVDFNGQSYITVDSIDTTKAIQTGFEWGVVTGSNNVTVSNSTASWHGQRGFRIGVIGYGTLAGDNNVIIDSVAHDNIGEGIWIGGGENNGCIRCELYNGGKDNVSKGYNTVDSGGLIVGVDAVNNFVKDSYIHDVYKGYVLMVEHENQADAAKPIGTVISGNVIVNNVPGLSITVEEEGENSVYSHNIIYSTESGGGDLIAMQTQGGVATGSISPTFYNNTLYMGSTEYGNLVNFLNVSNPVFVNNILYEPAGTDGNIMNIANDGDNNYNGLPASVTGTITSDYNLFYNNRTDYNYYHRGGYYLDLSEWQTATGLDEHSISGDPLFTDLSDFDFTLQEGSPAINAGTDVGLDSDHMGTSIPQGSSSDIGAYEFIITPSPTPTPTLTPTLTPTTRSSSRVKHESSSSTAPKCSAMAPDSVPDLFQIDTTSTKAKIYFAPIHGNTNNYVISYGYTSGDMRFGTQISGNSTGVMSLTINELSPNTTYYIKVRGGNDCAAGEWGNEMKFTTAKQGSVDGHRYYKSFLSRIIAMIQQYVSF